MASDQLTNASEITKALASNSSLIIKTLSYLIEKGLVEKKEKGLYDIEDPVFKLWLNKIEQEK